MRIVPSLVLFPFTKEKVLGMKAQLEELHKKKLEGVMKE
jgi:hypothetical protein